MSDRLRALVRAVPAALAVVAAALAAAAPAAGRATAGPFVLVRLASLGTITWRCEGARYGLGYQLPAGTATTRLVFRVGTAGQAVRTATLQPGGALRLPASRSVVQRIALAQATEPRTLRASIRVTFAREPAFGYCRSYLPPRVRLFLRAVSH